MLNSTTLYATLDEALADIAGRSFYENARVQREGDAWRVDDWSTGVDETLPWSYERGIELPGGVDVLDHSRTHEAYETYTDAGHIRYNLADAVAALEAGTAVGFTYIVAEAECEDMADDEREAGMYECGGDHAAGWALIATREMSA